MYTAGSALQTTRARLARRATVVASTVLVGLLAACSAERVSAPDINEPARADGLLDLFDKSGSSKKVAGLRRLTKLEKKEDVRKTIGMEGGVIELPQAGLRLTIPRGAVLFPVQFRVKAVDDKTVAYEFEPHGLVFIRPLEFSQSLANTEASGRTTVGGLTGAYFADVSQLVPAVGAIVNQLIPARLPGNNRVSIDIWHFSGYMMSTGRAMEETSPEF